MNGFCYRLYGLTLESDIELSELGAVHQSDHADVRITLGPVPNIGECREGYRVGESGGGFGIENVADYWVEQGRRIVVEPRPAADLRNVRLYLLGTAMGILLHQRGMLPLHSNAVEIGGRGYLFMGRSGAGKSTLASAFHDRGFRLIADDVSVIGFDAQGKAVVSPGIPRLRLWEEALHASGRSPSSYQLSYAGDESFRKFDVPVAAGSEAAAIGAIYLLARGERFSLRQLHGAEAADAIFANTYRGDYLRLAGRPVDHWSASVRLLEQVKVFELMRPWALGGIPSDLDQILTHVAALP